MVSPKRPFTSAKRVKRAVYLTQGKRVTHELDKSGFSRALFERFRAISSDFEQFQGTPGRLILRIEHPYLIWSRLKGISLDHIWYDLELSKSCSNICQPTGRP